jgi:hypothetical protein
MGGWQIAKKKLKQKKSVVSIFFFMSIGFNFFSATITLQETNHEGTPLKFLFTQPYQIYTFPKAKTTTPNNWVFFWVLHVFSKKKVYLNIF